MGDTYIKTYRKSLNNDLFKEKPFDKWHAFEYLLLRAQRFPTDIYLKGHNVHLCTGQLIESEDFLADKWGWSRGKVRRFLSQLNDTGMATSNGTTVGTVITIEKYTFYQGCDTADSTADDTAIGTTDDTADGTHKKKVKESKRKLKKDKYSYGYTREEWESLPLEERMRISIGKETK